HHAVDISDRQSEPGTLQQAAEIAQVGKWRNARRDPALAFGLRRREGLPEFGERVAADHRRQQEPVGLQRASYLRQHSGQVVGELKAERRKREIEALRRKWQGLLR